MDYDYISDYDILKVALKIFFALFHEFQGFLEYHCGTPERWHPTLFSMYVDSG